MIHKPPAFKGLNVRNPIMFPIKGRGFINQGSTLLLSDYAFLPLLLLCFIRPFTSLWVQNTIINKFQILVLVPTILVVENIIRYLFTLLLWILNPISPMPIPTEAANGLKPSTPSLR